MILKVAQPADLWKWNYYFYFNGLDFNGPYQLRYTLDSIPAEKAKFFFNALSKGLLYVMSDK